MYIDILLAIFSALAGAIISWYFATRKKSIHQKLKELDSHLEYISKLRKSSVELHRRAYTAIFFILLCLSIALGFSNIEKYFTLPSIVEPISFYVQLFAFLISIVISFENLRVYDNISNYQKALKRIQQKKNKLNEKLKVM